MKERIIFHIDVNSAFLSWEAAYRIYHLGACLDLRTIPSAIGGDVSMRHGIILAKSIPTKPYGIKTGMTILEARQKCPKLYLALPNYSLYQRCSQAFQHILQEYTPDVEVYSIDESFLDMTSTIHLYGDAVETAYYIKRRIKSELGFTVNVGISSNRLLAKMASEFEKPDKVHTLFPSEIKEKMWPLPVSELFFCGRATTKKLLSMGINTIGELAHTDIGLLKSNLKKQGETMWAFANGLDFSTVIAEAPAQKGYGNSTTTPFDVSDVETAQKVLLALCETVAVRLRNDNIQTQVLSVGIKSFDLRYASHQMRLKDPTNITIELYRYACSLFVESWDGKTPIRHLAVHASSLFHGDALRQMDLFDLTDYVRLETLDRTIDNIRHRYGNDSIKRAVFVQPSSTEHRVIDHMEGGISREKRSVDYSKLKIL
ncbi:Y-family DNA polymerase [Clostridium sp. C105KSO13]|uniref:Y-family DNA polymerase n=1 Tax=Clostridium sp. C105KSO13 TaxID=1776045 RepID=UPI00074089BC|nr:DNA polymerase IV [Clostridium sp. C105KSO13]CUX28421.1 DNA polymerase IV [Clostridium sp. C105KSO13]